MSRHIRVETRSRHQNDLKRVMHSTSKVRRWEKKWVRFGNLSIFKWMPIKSEEGSPQATTPIQQLQENIENIDQKNTNTNNRQTLSETDNKSSSMQAMNTGANGLHDTNSNGQPQRQNGTVAQQNGHCLQDYNHHQMINNKHLLASDNNDDSLLDTSVEFPPTKRQRTMPGSSFLGLGGDHQSSAPVLMSDIKVIDPNDSSLHNSSSSNFSQMNPTTTLSTTTTTSFVQQSTTINARPTQAQTDDTACMPASCSVAAGNNIPQQSQDNDIEMMEAETTRDNLTCSTARANSSQADDTVDMGDLSDIARAVTEQIVTKVSSYQGI